MSQEIINIAKSWAENTYLDESDRQEILNLINKNDLSELTERFYKELEFGTGGMRSIVGIGANRINKYTIRKATQAMATAIKNSFKKDELKVCLSYDSRNSSEFLSREVASVFAANEITCFLFKALRPTPLLSYSVRKMSAQGGVMITASHNPPNYNGFKAYWDDGCQVTPPHDKSIVDEYLKIEDFNSIKHMDFDQALAQGKIQWMPEEVESEYFKVLENECIDKDLCKNHGDELSIVYTPLHGTGGESVPTALKNIGLTNLHLVEEQFRPDGNFPTTDFPNPEDPEALVMAEKLMVKLGADVTVANDPDADRLGVIVMHEGRPFYPNGNQIGVLMLHYIISRLKENNEIPKNPLMVKTIVTSDLQRKIAEKYNVRVEDTLTGFKWICGRLKELEDQNVDFNFIFGTEESFGYLTHDQARDKDGVNAACLFCEMTLYYKKKGKSLVDALDDIYKEFGFHYEQLYTQKLEGIAGQEKIERLMETFRNYEDTSFAEMRISKISDYKLSEETVLESGVKSPISLPKSNVLGLEFTNGNKLYMRPSGTEPKIKFYIMIGGDFENLELAKKQAKDQANSIELAIKKIIETI